jgi:hypothetical protein
MRVRVLALLLAAACGDDGKGTIDTSAVVVPAVVAQATIERLDDARRESLKNQCAALLMAAELHYVTSGKRPTSVDELVAAKQLPELPKDPWGSAFALAQHGEDVWITSIGPDRQAATTDDVRCEPMKD